MCSISPFSNSLPSTVSGSSSPKVISTNKCGSALQTDKANTSQYSSKHSDVGITAGATWGLGLSLDTASSTSFNGTSLYVTPQSTSHPFLSSYPQPIIGTAGSVSKAVSQSYPQSTISNPNLRFIAAHYQDHNKPNKRFINTPKVGNNTSVATTVESGHPFPSVTSLQVALGVQVDDSNATSASDETNRPQKHSRNQESSTRKQSKAIKRHSVDIEPINSDGPRKLKRQKGSSYSKNNIEHSETVELGGPSSIAYAFNNVATGDQATKPAPSQVREKQATNTTTGISHAVHAYQGSAGTSDVFAIGSKTKSEDTNNAEGEDDEDEDDDITVETLIDTTDSACNHASLVSSKVWCWADKLKEIRRAQVDSLFEEETASIPAREILELLKDIDEDKNWATQGEVEDAQIEQLLEALVYRDGLEDGSEGSKLAVRILDNFAQRFRGVRYLPR